MASQVEVINHALRLLKAQRIASMGDSTPEAVIMQDLYGPVRDELLRAYPWNFAIERVSLARLATTPVFGYAYEYQLPPDCLGVLELDDDTARYKIEGKKLRTDAVSVKIKYTRQITDESQFDAQFTAVFANRLAIEAAYSLVGKENLIKFLWDLYNIRIGEAKVADSIENYYDVMTDTTLTDER